MKKINFTDKNSFLFKILFIFCLLFAGCKTTSLLNKEEYSDYSVLPIEILTPNEFIWESLSNTKQNELQSSSAFYTQYIIKEENIKWVCVKIDLNEDWEIAAEPLYESLGKRFYLRNFSNEYKTTVAVNTVPFSGIKQKYIPTGIVKINGNIICPANSKYCALALKKVKINEQDFPISTDSDNLNSDNSEKSFVWRAKIFSSQNEQDLKDYDYAFGGFFVILDNENIFEFKKYKSSRTAVGLSENGRFLYLFATCKINQPFSENGLNFEECALILQKMGCTNAMEFDGGRSSGLTIGNKNFIKPPFQRKISAAFGLKSKQH